MANMTFVSIFWSCVLITLVDAIVLKSARRESSTRGETWRGASEIDATSTWRRPRRVSEKRSLLRTWRGDPNCAPSCPTSRPLFGDNGLSLTPSVWLAVGPLTDSEALTDELQAFGGVQQQLRAKEAHFTSLVAERSSRQEMFEKHLAKKKNTSEIIKVMAQAGVVQLNAETQGKLPRFPSDAGPLGSTVWAMGYRDDSDPANPYVYMNFTQALQSANRSAGFGGDPDSYGGYAIGNFTATGNGATLIRCTDPFYLDQRPHSFLGDVYDGGRAVHALHLSPGPHLIFVRFSYASFWCDIMDDSKDAREVAARVSVTGSPRSPLIIMRDFMMSDVVDGQLASPYVSVPILNAEATPIELRSASVLHGPHNLRLKPLKDQRHMPILSGQIYPMRLEFEQDGPLKCSNGTKVRGDNGLDDFLINITLELWPKGNHTPAQVNMQTKCYAFKKGGKTRHLAAGGYRVTFPDFDGSIQEMWVAPPNSSMGSPPRGYPVMLSLHGAQVETGPNWGHNYAQRDDKTNQLEFDYPAWLVEPSNRLEWGTDWQGPGYDNAVAAIQYVTENLPGAPSSNQELYRIDTSRMLVTGHSMGGHGCFVWSTHEPDLLLGSVCAAPWPSMAHYSGTPSTLLDAAHSAPLQAQEFENAADRLAANIRGNPLTVIYGDADDNVPPSEPRYMARMVDSYSDSGIAAKIIELPGVPHWFPQNIPEMSGALWEHFPMNAAGEGIAEMRLPSTPETFEFTVMNPVSFGTKGNMKILQQEDAARPSKLFVRRCVANSTTDDLCQNLLDVCGQSGEGAAADAPWIIDTENVRRFTFVVPVSDERPLPRVVRIDGKVFSLAAMNTTKGQHFCSRPPDSVGGDVSWSVCIGTEWESVERGGPSAGTGPMHMVLRRAPVCIVHGNTNGLLQQALSLAKRLYYVSRYAVPIVDASKQSFEDASYCADANLILLGHPTDNAWLDSLRCSFDYVQFHNSTSKGFTVRGESYSGSKIGLLALGQLRAGRLGLVVHGTDNIGLMRASQRVPISAWQTGADFLVLGPDAGWQGSGGILAGGYLDAYWQPSATSSWAEKQHAVSGANWVDTAAPVKLLDSPGNCANHVLVAQRLALQAERLAQSWSQSIFWRRSEQHNSFAMCSSAYEVVASNVLLLVLSALLVPL